MRPFEMEQMQLSDPELPPRPQGKTISDLLEERERDAWYWQALAFLAAMLIMVGFLVFGGAFLVQDNDRASQQTIPVTVVALVLINAGYILSVGLWFLRRNWLYQLDCVFLPCLFSSLLGFVNTLVVPKLVLGAPELTAPALASLLVSLVSSVIYSLLAVYTWRRIQKLRRAKLQPSASGLIYVSEEELQRRQMSNLLAQRDQCTAATLASQRTYHIDMPIPKSKTDNYSNMNIIDPPSYTY